MSAEHGIEPRLTAAYGKRPCCLKQIAHGHKLFAARESFS